MKIFSVLLVVLLLLGGLAWWYRDLLPFGDGGGESVEVSEAAAATAADKLEQMREDGEPVRLSSVELSSLLRYRSPSWAATSVSDPEIHMAGDTLWVAGTIPTDRIPPHPDLDRVRGLLPDSARLEVRGNVRSLGSGRAALAVRQVEFAGIPIPERYYPTMLDRLGRSEEAGLAPSEMSLPLPPGITEARVEDGYLVLIP
jgi:hypothetical protein